MIESVFERLVDWAAAAFEKSSNQPVLPHAIIVLNASEYDINPDLWSVHKATTQMLESISKTVYQNATFTKYAQFWRERHRQIETIEQLLHAYYSSARVVRIPTSGRPNLIQDQIQELQHRINSACTFVRERKVALRMLTLSSLIYSSHSIILLVTRRPHLIWYRRHSPTAQSRTTSEATS